MKKKVILAAMALFMTPGIWAQSAGQEPDLGGNNEFSINGLTTILGSPEISYERLLSGSSGWGISAMFTTDLEYDVYSTLMIGPYYRVYFNREELAKGFFLEGSLPFILGEKDWVYYYDEATGVWQEPEDPNELTLQVGAGFSAGWKFMTESGYTGTVFFGLTRNFTPDSYFTFYPKMGLSIGRRF